MKSFIRTMASIFFLSGSLAFGQTCVSQNCANHMTCIQDMTSKCYSGLNCPSINRCLVTPGTCEDGLHFCSSRICTESRNCPPNTESVTKSSFQSVPYGKVEVGGRIITYAGLQNFSASAFPKKLWKKFSDPQFLLSHPLFVRMDNLLGYTVYVLSERMQSGEVVEKWYAPSAGTGPMPLRLIVKSPEETLDDIVAVDIQ